MAEYMNQWSSLEDYIENNKVLIQAINAFSLSLSYYVFFKHSNSYLKFIIKTLNYNFAIITRVYDRV